MIFCTDQTDAKIIFIAISSDLKNLLKSLAQNWFQILMNCQQLPKNK